MYEYRADLWEISLVVSTNVREGTAVGNLMDRRNPSISSIYKICVDYTVIIHDSSGCMLV